METGEPGRRSSIAARLSHFQGLCNEENSRKYRCGTPTPSDPVPKGSSPRPQARAWRPRTGVGFGLPWGIDRAGDERRTAFLKQPAQRALPRRLARGAAEVPHRKQITVAYLGRDRETGTRPPTGARVRGYRQTPPARQDGSPGASSVRCSIERRRARCVDRAIPCARSRSISR